MKNLGSTTNEQIMKKVAMPGNTRIMLLSNLVYLKNESR